MKPVAVMLLYCLIATSGYSQCSDTFEVKSIQKATSAANDGKIIVTVSTTRAYSCKLVSYRNAERTTVSEKSGVGSSTIIFDKLNNTDLYRISFTFPAEEDPFCQTRIIDQITLTGNKRKL